jgi:SPP1 gp7 family putative phage head morphogenesis protein
MKILGYEIRKAQGVTSEAQIRENNPQGPYTKYFQDYVFRKVSGEFYEFLREAIPIIDSGIRRLISLNGTIKIIGDKPEVVAALEDFCLNVPVNDQQKGMQAFIENFANETFEQGFSISEFTATPDMKDIAGLRVADSKNITFCRDAKTGRAEPWYRYPGNQPRLTNSTPGTLIERILNARYVQTRSVNGIDEVRLNPSNILYNSINNENSDPGGVSVMRSMEFVSQILATLQNSIKSVGERFGDPSYHVHYKASKIGAEETLETRRLVMYNEFQKAITAKRQGSSADFVTAGSQDSDVVVKVIGHDGQILEYEIPLRHVLEQIVSKLNLPAWMLGIYWSTTERMATLEVEAALQDAKIRQLSMLPELIRLFSVYLSLRGFKWNTVTTSVDRPGDWGIVFETPNLRDLVAQAQARFLNAQADMMGAAGNTAPGTQTQVTVGAATVEIQGMKFPLVTRTGLKTYSSACGCPDHQRKELRRPKPWPELDDLETKYLNELMYDWNELGGRVTSILGFTAEGKAAGAEVQKDDNQVFSLSGDQIDQIKRALEQYLQNYKPSEADSSIRYFYGQALSLGYLHASYEVGSQQSLLNILKNSEIYNSLCKNGFDLVKNNATRRIIDQIIPEMQSYSLSGSNPKEVAGRLEKLFGDQNANWDRLARSEMSMAAEDAKLAEWKERGIKTTEFTPAPDACPICMALAGEYPIGTAPVPVRDTHPECRCSNRPGKGEVSG